MHLQSVVKVCRATCVFDPQKNRLIETVLLSTQNICKKNKGHVVHGM